MNKMAEHAELQNVQIYGVPYTHKGRKGPQFTYLRPSFDAMEDDGTAHDNATNKTIHEVTFSRLYSIFHKYISLSKAVKDLTES